MMVWHIICLNPSLNETIDEFPFYFGRLPGPTSNCVVMEDPTISRSQFTLEERLDGIYYVNHSVENAGELDGRIVQGEEKLSSFQVYVLKLGDITITLGTNYAKTLQAALKHSAELYMVNAGGGKEIGPLTGAQLIEGYRKNYFSLTTRLRALHNPNYIVTMQEVIDFENTNGHVDIRGTSEAVTPARPETSAKLGRLSSYLKRNKALVFSFCGGCAAVFIVTLIVISIVTLLRSTPQKDYMPIVSGPTTTTNEETVTETVIVREAIAFIKCKERNGTGFLLNMNGKTYLLSNEHVMRSGDRIEARLVDGTFLQLGEFAVAEDRRDLARFEVLNCKKEPLRFREDMPLLGEQITVYGNSLGSGVATESKGFIQGVGPTKIETNAEIVSGSSGSPLLDASNIVIGVAAFMELTDTGRENWGNMNTRYDGKVRRYAVRLNNVKWKTVERREYEKQVRIFAEFKTFFNYLVPFLLLETGKVAKENLVYDDLCSKDFSMREIEFNDILEKVAKAYEERNKVYIRWDERVKDRKELVRELNIAIDKRQLKKGDAEKVLSEYDEKTIEAYKKMKEMFQKMIIIRKDALNYARTFLLGQTWDTPQILKGYDGDSRESIDSYLKVIATGIDLMNQKMKDLNKILNEIEGDDNGNR